MFKDSEFDMVVGITTLGSPNQETAESNITVKQIAGFSLLTLELEAKKSNL
jgi:hypothetical protein